MRRGQQDISRWMWRIAAAATVLVLVAICGLTIYGSTLTYEPHWIEKVISDGRFAR